MVALDAGVADTGKRTTNPGGVALACVFVDADADADRCYDQAVAPRPPCRRTTPSIPGKGERRHKPSGETQRMGDEDTVVAIAKEAGFIITIDEIKQAQSGIKELSEASSTLSLAFGRLKPTPLEVALPIGRVAAEHQQAAANA